MFASGAVKSLRYSCVLDILIYVYACAAALDIAFAPGRTASFEAGLLGLLIFFLSALGLLASVAPRLIIRTYVFGLERYAGKGVLNILLGVVTFASSPAWRAGCSFFAIAFGFAWLLVALLWRPLHPRALLGCGETEAAGGGAAGGVLTSALPVATPVATPVAAPVAAPSIGGRPFNPFLAQPQAPQV